MRVGARPQEPGPHGYDEISVETSPHEVEIVVLAPDSHPGAGDGIDLLLRIELTRTVVMKTAQVALVLKLTEGILIGCRRHAFIHSWATRYSQWLFYTLLVAQVHGRLWFPQYWRSRPLPKKPLLALQQVRHWLSCNRPG